MYKQETCFKKSGQYISTMYHATIYMLGSQKNKARCGLTLSIWVGLKEEVKFDLEILMITLYIILETLV